MNIANIVASVTAAHFAKDLKNSLALICISVTAIQFHRSTHITRTIPWDTSDGMPQLNYAFPVTLNHT